MASRVPHVLERAQRALQAPQERGAEGVRAVAADRRVRADHRRRAVFIIFFTSNNVHVHSDFVASSPVGRSWVFAKGRADPCASHSALARITGTSPSGRDFVVFPAPSRRPQSAAPKPPGARSPRASFPEPPSSDAASCWTRWSRRWCPRASRSRRSSSAAARSRPPGVGDVSPSRNKAVVRKLYREVWNPEGRAQARARRRCSSSPRTTS